jgi:hypothetical protein
LQHKKIDVPLRPLFTIKTKKTKQKNIFKNSKKNNSMLHRMTNISAFKFINNQHLDVNKYLLRERERERERESKKYNVRGRVRAEYTENKSLSHIFFVIYYQSDEKDFFYSTNYFRIQSGGADFSGRRTTHAIPLWEEYVRRNPPFL